MSRENLTQESVESGFELTTKLLEAGFPVGFAGWIYAEEVSEWRFYIATPLYLIDGPQKTTRLLMRFLDIVGDEVGIDFDDVQIGPSEAAYIDAIRKDHGVERSPVRIDDYSFSDQHETIHVKGAYLYHSAPPTGREALEAARRRFAENLAELNAA